MSKRFSPFTLYVRYLRRSSHHLQHLHALFFALVITGGIAYVILYTNYGFWNSSYSNKEKNTEQLVVSAIEEKSSSPFEVLAEIVEDSKKVFKDNATTSFLEGKKTYSQKESFLQGDVELGE